MDGSFRPTEIKPEGGEIDRFREILLRKKEKKRKKKERNEQLLYKATVSWLSE